MTDKEFAKTFPNMKWLLPHSEPSQSEPSWSELPGNVVPSAVNAATGLYEMARHPTRTLQALESAAGGAMNLMGADEINAYLADRGLAVRRKPQDVTREEAAATAVGQALKDRYWGLDNIKRTMITDPFGSALDVIGVATGVGGLVRGGLSVGSKARLAEIPGAARNTERLAANELGQTIAADSKQQIFDPPDRPQRPFEADHPNGAIADEKGTLLVDKYGNPLIAKYRPGRQTLGGGDVGLSHDEFHNLGEDSIEKKIETVPYGSLGRDGRSLGQLGYNDRTNKPLTIRIVDNLPKEEHGPITSHEVAHAVDVATGRQPIDTPDMQADLERIYSDLATGIDGGEPLTLPSARGYSGTRTRDELMGEGFRAAIANPNYFKSVAPKTIPAYRISKSKIAHLLQLNSLAAAAAAGVGLLGQRDDSQASDLTQNSDVHNLSPFDPPKGTAKAGLNGMSMIAAALVKRDLSSKAPKTGQFTDLVNALVKSRRALTSRDGPRL